MSAIRHVVFDIGGVLIEYDPERAFIELLPDAGERRWFLDNVCTSQWNAEQDRGRGWAQAEAELIAEFPDHIELIRAFRRNWHRMITGPVAGTVDILTALTSGGHDVTMLTNFAADTFAEARGRFGFLDEPRGVSVSGELGLIKPDAAIYHHHAEAFDLEPAATLFIDDVAGNVAGAKAAGWQAVQFVDAPTLAADLAGFGIEVDRAAG